MNLQWKSLDEDWRDTKREVKDTLNSLYPSKWSPLKVGVSLVVWFFAITTFVTSRYYALPDPVPAYNVNRFSEARARQHIRVLSQDIGQREVGTLGEDRSIHYITAELEKLRDAPKVSHPFEISTKSGSGQHLFEIINVPIVKTYHNVTNIAVRFTCTDECASDKALLVNTHFDTMLGSNGAADAATPVAIMIDAIRMLSTATRPLRNSVVFLFNGAEETFQDASHLFMTTHPWFKDVVAVVNLEAAGVSGKSILFQSKSALMTEAYSHVSHPHGSSMANDLFKSGLLISDTDYKQFMDHGKLKGGLDMAIYQHSYLYHTKLDREDVIPAGVIQHMGANSLDIIAHIAFSANLDNVEDDGDHTYFDFNGLFFVLLPAKVATNAQILIAIAAIAYLYRTTAARTVVSGLVDVLRTIGVGAFFPIGVALSIMTTDYKMLWFAEPSFASVLYGAPAVYGLIQGHLMGKGPEPTAAELAAAEDDDEVDANKAAAAAAASDRQSIARKGYLAFTTLLMVASMALGLQTSFVFAIYVISYLAALFAPSTLFYHVAMTLPILVVQPMMIGTINTFVPLAGRMGPYIPAELIVAGIVWLATTLILLPLLPTFHALSHKAVRRWGRVFAVIGMVMWANFAATSPRYTVAAPKRMVLLHSFDMDTQTSNLHLIKGDSAPYPRDVVQGISALAGGFPVREEEAMTRAELFEAHQSLYPISELTHSLHWNTTHLDGKYWVHEDDETVVSGAKFGEAYAPRVRGIKTVTHTNGSRTITIPCEMNTHNLATVFRFDADVVASSAPMARHARSGQYLIRQSSAGHGAVAWTDAELADKETYPASACDFSFTTADATPVTIHAAAMTKYMGARNYLLRRALTHFGNNTQVFAVDAVHKSIVV
ncbi:hypothetical protein H9P43_002759 [Blastocladiella emersonii ATCC 22665]|nr:hypothetical protein H9P43_002759 [Blastocladiella emersonii ATCC 22665]